MQIILIMLLFLWLVYLHFRKDMDVQSISHGLLKAAVLGIFWAS